MTTAKEKLLSFDEVAWNSELRILNKSILPAVNDLRTEYDSLSIGEFNQKVYDSIRSNHFRSIPGMEEKYQAAIQADLKNFKTPALRKIASENAGEQLSVIRRLLAVLQNQYSNRMAGYPIHWGNIHIVNGEAVIDPEEIKKHYEVRISNEVEEKLMNLLAALQVSYKDLADFVKIKGIRTGIQPFALLWQFFIENNDKSIEVAPTAVKNISYYQN